MFSGLRRFLPYLCWGLALGLQLRGCVAMHVGTILIAGTFAWFWWTLLQEEVITTRVPTIWRERLLGAGTALAVSIAAMVIYSEWGSVASSPPAGIPMPVLSPPQERLLALIHEHQTKSGAGKVVILRTGQLHFDEAEGRTVDISILAELYGVEEGDVSRASEFETLMEGMPREYLRFFPEVRVDNPFVVAVTPAGIRYLRGG